MAKHRNSCAKNGDKPRICVVMPAFKSAETLRAAVASVIRLQYDYITILISIRSEDFETKALAEQLACENVLLVFQQGVGVSNARNAALNEFTADYYMFLDSDDTYCDGMLESYLNDIKRHPSPSLRYANWNCHLPFGKKVFKSPFWTSDPAWSRFNLLIENYIPTGSVMIDRTIFETVGLFNEDLSHAEDWEYWMRIHRNFPVRKIPVTAFNYRHSKLFSIKPRKFWLQEASIVRGLEAPFLAKLLAHAGIRGRYALYFLRTLRQRKFREYLDISISDIVLIPIALTIKIFRYVAK